MDHARGLRQGQTETEGRLWSRLRNYQMSTKFRRQHRAEGYILDFACVEWMLAVELDGGQHAERIAEDVRRTATLSAAGWQVLRFWNHDALSLTDEVVAEIWRVLGQKRRQRQELPFGPTAKFATLHLRAQLNKRIRTFFEERNVMEVETPILSAAGNTDPNIASFSLEFSGRTEGAPCTRWLRTSPEFALKRLLAAGIGDCYEMGRVFRDGEAGGRHNPEFTMLEWYRVGWDHQQLIDEVAALVQSALALVGRTASLERIAWRDLYRQHLDLDPITANIADLRAALGDIRIDPNGLERDDWLDLLLTHRLQPAFVADRMVAVYDYPASQAALARVHPGDPPVAERFELYLGPLEVANGYHELTDAIEQRERFGRDVAKRRQRGVKAPPIDERLLSAMVSGLPACAGVALGIDRLLMAMLRSDRIADVLAFPFDRA